MTKSVTSAQPRTLLEALRSPASPIVWDGGIGTALIARGLVLGTEPPEAWLWSRPEEVAAVHRGFAEARVDVLQTNSFGLVRLLATDALPRPPDREHSPTLVDYVKRSVDLARAQLSSPAHRPAWVVASLGPTGAVGVDEGKLTALYGEAATAFAQHGVAALHLETCFDATELRVAMRAIRDAVPELTLFVSLTVTHGQQGLETPLGVPLARMLRELEDEPPALIGVNCSQNADRMRGSAFALAQWAQSGGRAIPVLARPQLHSGTPDCKRPPKEISPQQFAKELLALLDEGATAIGGCCGVTAAHLAAVRQTIEGYFLPPSTL